jgi:hypothetical protein
MEENGDIGRIKIWDSRIEIKFVFNFGFAIGLQFVLRTEEILIVAPFDWNLE